MRFVAGLVQKANALLCLEQMWMIGEPPFRVLACAEAHARRFSKMRPFTPLPIGVELMRPIDSVEEDHQGTSLCRLMME